MSNSTLPVISLAYPLVLLPTARIAVPVHMTVGEMLLQGAQDSETQPVVAAVPTSSSDNYIPHDWGCAARIVRIIRPPKSLGLGKSRPYLLTLHGLSRVHLPEKTTRSRLDGRAEHIVEYATGEGVPSVEAATTFKTAALQLLDRLSKDVPSEPKRDFYSKLAAMVDEVSNERTAWMADE